MKIRITLLIGIISLISSPVYAGMIDSGGFDFLYGSELPHIVESSSHTHRVARYIARAGKQLSKHWELEGEGYFSQHVSNPKIPGETRYRARESGVNLVVHYQFGNRTWVADPYIGWCAGLSWLIDEENQPNWAESGCLGTWGPMAGISIPITIHNDVRAEFRITHSSDPFGSDSGRNFRCISVGFTHYF
jgi:hypothetical protein